MQVRWVVAVVAGACALAACQPQPPPLQATDVAAAAGIARTTNDSEGNSVVFDYDGDGTTDLLLGNHGRAPWELFRGDGDGTFTRTQTLRATDRHRCTTADFDTDGRPDLYCSVGAGSGHSASKSNELWLQDEARRFVETPGVWTAVDPSGRGRDSTAFDVDNDPFPDLFVGNAVPVDFPSPNRLWRNVGGLSFLEDTTSGLTQSHGGYCAEPSDYDGDGWDDIFVCGSRAYLYRSTLGVTFQDRAVELGLTTERPWDADWADVDGDGDGDLVLTGTTFVRVWRNDGGGALTPLYRRALQYGRTTAAGDVDADGDLDLWVVQGLTRTDVLLLNDGTGAFAPFTGALPQVSSGNGNQVEAIPDWNGTGRAAFLVTNGFGTGTLGPRQLITFSGG